MSELIVGFECGDKALLYVIERLKEQLDALLKRNEISAYSIEIAVRNPRGELAGTVVLETKETPKQKEAEQ